MDERRVTNGRDRRASGRGGRRNGDRGRPWYLRRRLWLTMVSLVYVGWRRLHRPHPAGTPGPATRAQGPHA